MSLRRSLAQEYDIIAWVIRIFIGGAIETLFINALVNFSVPHFIFLDKGNQIITNLHPDQFPAFAFLIAIVVISPFLLSLCLTKRHPELRIVPSFYIALMGILLSIILNFSLIDANNFIIPVFSLYFPFFCLFEDRLVTSLLGIGANRDYIYFEHRKVYANIEDVKKRLTKSEIRNGLFLSPRIEGDAEQGYLLRSRGLGGFYGINTRIKLSKSKESPNDRTDVKVVYFEKGQYNLRMSARFIEEMHKTSAYLSDVFYKHEPSLGFEVVVDYLDKNKSDEFVDSIVDETFGYYSASKRLTMIDWVRIIALISFLVATPILFVIELPVYGGLSLLADVLVGISAIPDLMKKRTND
jgi:hypothetical protein